MASEPKRLAKRYLRDAWIFPRLILKEMLGRFPQPTTTPLLSPAVGQSYGVGSALVHATCLFFACAAFFSLAVLLSSVFADVWRPLLIALFVAGVLNVCEQAFRGLSRYAIFGLMNGEIYFRTGSLPLAGLLVSAVASVAMLYGATVRTARRDF